MSTTDFKKKWPIVCRKMDQISKMVMITLIPDLFVKNWEVKYFLQKVCQNYRHFVKHFAQLYYFSSSDKQRLLIQQLL
jgi:hypothetical protein